MNRIRSKNILILDDNKYILEALSASLRIFLKDCATLTASNGAEGEEIMRSEHIDLVLADLDMPVMNGYEFIERVKKLDGDLPVCVMTGACTPEIAERLRSMGVRWCIEKPFNFKELSRMISEELVPARPANSLSQLSHS